MNILNLLQFNDPDYLQIVEYFLILVMVFILSISFHERSHAWAAWKLGDDTAYLAGRLTMNPLAHLDLFGFLMVLFVGIGWAKPVPINPVRFRGPMKRGIVLVSVAGPVSNLILAFLSSFLYFGTAALIGTGTLGSLLLTFFGTMIYLNISLAVFNFLPVPPLDGYKVLGAVLPNRIYYTLMRYERYIGIGFLVVAYMASGFLSGIIRFFAVPIQAVILYPATQLFGLLGFFG
jgi:Zn-dependent protease